MIGFVTEDLDGPYGASQSSQDLLIALLASDPDAAV